MKKNWLVFVPILFLGCGRYPYNPQEYSGNVVVNVSFNSPIKANYRFPVSVTSYNENDSISNINHTYSCQDTACWLSLSYAVVQGSKYKVNVRVDSSNVNLKSIDEVVYPDSSLPVEVFFHINL